MRLIDADALMTELNDTKYAWQTYDEVEGALRNIPTVEVKDLVEYHMDEMSRTIHYRVVEAEPVRHGRWEWRGGIPWCSNCGEMPPGYSYDGDVNTTPYCPNCGAMMGVTDINVGNKGGDST